MRNVSSTSATRGGRRHPRRRQLAAVRQHVDEEIDAPLFRPAAVLAESERARDRIDGLGVALGFLPHVEPHQRQPEGRHPAEDVGQPAVGDDAVAGGVQRAMAEEQRLHELRHRLEHLRLPREAGPAGVPAGASVAAAGAARRSSSMWRRDASTRCCSARSRARYGSCAPSTCARSSGVASDIESSNRSCSISFA